MKTRLFLACALVALVASGCGQKDTSTTAAAAAPAGPREIEITAGDTMKFSVTAIDAKPGEDIKVVLTNNGTQPIEVMGHNWVLLTTGADVAAFDAAALTSKETATSPPPSRTRSSPTSTSSGRASRARSSSRPPRPPATIPSSALSPPTTRRA